MSRPMVGCRRHPKRPVLPGSAWCELCKAARDRWYARRKAAGLCVQTGCRKKAKPPSVRCAWCLASEVAMTREIKRRPDVKARAAEKERERKQLKREARKKASNAK